MLIHSTHFFCALVNLTAFEADLVIELWEDQLQDERGCGHA
jgi:hypothetical protein